MKTLATTLVAILGLHAACGSDGGGAPIPIGDLQAVVTAATCDVYVRCDLLPDQASCAALPDLHNPVIDPTNDLVAAIAAGKVIYHPDKARACLDLFSSASCDRDKLFSNRDLPEACGETFVGTLGDMATCALSLECISGDCDVDPCPDACCMGTCFGGTPAAAPKVGEACAATLECVDSFCDSSTSICTAYLADGAPCELSLGCASGLCMTTCVKLAATNAPCSTTAQCQEIGDVCSTLSHKCVAAGKLGASCGSDVDCLQLYACDTGTGKCIERAHVGEPCAQLGCAEGYCDMSTMMCAELKPDGASCMSSLECAGLNCDLTTTNTCVTPGLCI